MDWKFGVFFHFGIRSFYPGHKDWDGISMSPDAFNPTQLDCEQWVRTAKQAGAAYTILVTKHHDGFANWPSAYTSYSVAHSPWKNGKGDVVREYVNACRKYGVKVGLYYSPAQWGEGAVSFQNDRDYDDYFINQIGELLTGYGQIDYLWFDGCGSEGHEYDKDRIIAAIRGWQPEIRIFSMWDPDTAWVGNEDGFAPMPNFNTRAEEALSIRATEAEKLTHQQFLPAECDFKMRTTWFDSQPNENTVKSVSELVGIYEYSVGHGANFLINIGPDHRGLLPEKDAARLLEFGQELRRRYSAPLPYTDCAPGTEADTFSIRPLAEFVDNYEIPYGELADTVVLEEDLSEGESVRRFDLFASMPNSRSQELCLFHGDSIGHQFICRFPAIRASAFTLKIREHDGDYRIRSIKAFFTEKN